MGGHTRHRFIHNRRIRWRLSVGIFTSLIPTPGLTGAYGRGGGYAPPNHDYAFWSAMFAEPIAVYILITALILWRSPAWDPWDARAARSLMRRVLRDGGGRRRGKPDAS